MTATITCDRRNGRTPHVPPACQVSPAAQRMVQNCADWCKSAPFSLPTFTPAAPAIERTAMSAGLSSAIASFFKQRPSCPRRRRRFATVSSGGEHLHPSATAVAGLPGSRVRRGRSGASGRARSFHTAIRGVCRMNFPAVPFNCIRRRRLIPTGAVTPAVPVTPQFALRAPGAAHRIIIPVPSVPS